MQAHADHDQVDSIHQDVGLGKVAKEEKK